MLNFKYRAIFFLGIKGVAMANLALIYKKKGISVSGWDTEEEFITDKNLIEAGICVFTNSNFNISNNIDIVVYSAAHGGINNPIIKDAVKKGIKAISQSELISQLLMDFETTIGVSGCHGKTTTSGLLSFVLSKLSTETAHLVGVSGFNNLTGGY
jgi:UDP-N-acetylmuramate--alanine ligase